MIEECQLSNGQGNWTGSLSAHTPPATLPQPTTASHCVHISINADSMSTCMVESNSCQAETERDSHSFQGRVSGKNAGRCREKPIAGRTALAGYRSAWSCHTGSPLLDLLASLYKYHIHRFLLFRLFLLQLMLRHNTSLVQP